MILKLLKLENDDILTLQKICGPNMLHISSLNLTILSIQSFYFKIIYTKADRNMNMSETVVSYRATDGNNNQFKTIQCSQYSDVSKRRFHSDLCLSQLTEAPVCSGVHTLQCEMKKKD